MVQINRRRNQVPDHPTRLLWSFGVTLNMKLCTTYMPYKNRHFISWNWQKFSSPYINMNYLNSSCRFAFAYFCHKTYHLLDEINFVETAIISTVLNFVLLNNINTANQRNATKYLFTFPGYCVTFETFLPLLHWINPWLWSSDLYIFIH